MVTDIKQLLTHDQFKAIQGANSPNSGNVFATMADLPVIAGNVKSEYLYPSSTIYTKSGITPMSDFANIVFPVDPAVIDGRARKIQIITVYDKLDNDSASINFRVITGGLTLTFTAFSPGVGIISGRNIIFEFDMTFAASNTQRAMCRFYNQTNAAEINRQTVSNTGTWDKTIVNLIRFQWETVTGLGINHQLTVNQITSILI